MDITKWLCCGLTAICAVACDSTNTGNPVDTPIGVGGSVASGKPDASTTPPDGGSDGAAGKRPCGDAGADACRDAGTENDAGH